MDALHEQKTRLWPTVVLMSATPNLFFKENNKASVCERLDSTNWQMKLAYLADIYQLLNNLNTSMQGAKESILTSTDKLLAFKETFCLEKAPFKRKRRNVSTPTSS